ncbi:MAG: hypothetical protein V3S33_02810 [Gammaproteobacteria bacterium]
MKILCIVSAGTGHLDFGGMGFVKLAKKLMARGHEVTWIGGQQQIGRLRPFNFDVEDQTAIDVLTLNNFVSATDIGENSERYLSLLQHVHYFQNLIASHKPGLILFDRLMAYAAMVAEGLGIPYAAVGTPGGYWRLDDAGTHPSDAPVQAYSQVGEAIRNDLGWGKGSLNSFWVNSPLLNICFIGKDFYRTPPAFPSASVHHFADKPAQSAGARFGISFGNQGNESILKIFTECLIRQQLVREPLDIFLGNNEKLFNELQPKYQTKSIQFHRWVDFSKHFPELKCLAFFGGIGTIWHCIDNYLPMLIVPGMAGDQLYNGGIVSERGLGECLPMVENSYKRLRPILARLGVAKGYHENITALRSKQNYSDTMESVCERLEKL